MGMPPCTRSRSYPPGLLLFFFLLVVVSRFMKTNSPNNDELQAKKMVTSYELTTNPRNFDLLIWLDSKHW